VFQCSKCRVRKGAVYNSLSWRLYHNDGLRSCITLTGKRRPRRSEGATPLGSMSRTERQYTCNDCGHTGWSRHCELELAERVRKR
jgi:hypothetical protein